MKRWIHASSDISKEEYKDFVNSVIDQSGLSQYFKYSSIWITPHSDSTIVLDLKFPYRVKNLGVFADQVRIVPEGDWNSNFDSNYFVMPSGDYQAAQYAVDAIKESIDTYTEEYQLTSEYKTEAEFKSYTEDRYSDYLQKCKDLVNEAQLTRFIKDIDTDSYGMVEVSLNDPYKVGKDRYGYISTILLVPGNQWRSNDPGFVERVIPFNSSKDRSSVRKLKELKNRIQIFTDDYTRSLEQESADPLSLTNEVKNQLENMCYETYDNYPEVTLDDAVDIIIEHLVDPDIYGLKEGKDFNRSNVEEVASTYYL